MIPWSWNNSFIKLLQKEQQEYTDVFPEAKLTLG